MIRALLAALVALPLTSQTPLPSQTPAPPAPQVPANPTFTQHVAPIVFHNCATCHRPGEVAPFPLLSFADVQKRGKMITRVVEAGFMPPWHPEPGFGEFRNCLRLSQAEVDTIGTWVRQGMPEGPADALPPVPKFDSDWHLGPPDLVVEMKDGFDVPASGRDIYRNFVVPVGAAEDHWIAAIDLRPSARAVLHHVLVFLDDSGEAQQLDGKDGRPGFAGMVLRRAQPIGGWAAGGRAEQLPDGLGIKLPKGNDLVLQSHFHPSGKKATEKTVIGLYFTKVPPVRTIVPIQLPPFFGVAAGIDIKPGDKNWLLQDSFTLPCAVEAVTVGGHAHMLGKTMRLVAKLPDGRQEPLLLIRNWDFDWQNRYTYQGFPRLPTGSVLHAEITYDNSSDNPNNPNRPPKEVRWGRESTDEMGSITLMVVAGDEQELATLQAALRAKIVSSAGKGAESVLEQRFRQMDKNGDGKVTRDEVPARMRRMFEMLDKNGDGALDMDEIKGLLGNLGGIGDDPAPSKPKGKSGDGKGNDGK